VSPQVKFWVEAFKEQSVKLFKVGWVNMPGIGDDSQTMVASC